jgi:hypothetical protein
MAVRLARSFCFVALSWLSLQLPCSECLDFDDVVCVFSQQEEPEDILRMLTHHPHIKLNMFYWHLSELGFNIASLSLPPSIAIDLANDSGARCEPVQTMRIASSEYAESLRQKYLKRRSGLEKSIQCTITYDTYEQLFREPSHSKARHPNNIVCPLSPLPPR